MRVSDKEQHTLTRNSIIGEISSIKLIGNVVSYSAYENVCNLLLYFEHVDKPYFFF